MVLGLSKEHKPQPPRANAHSLHQKSDSKVNQKSGRRGRIFGFELNFLNFEKSENSVTTNGKKKTSKQDIYEFYIKILNKVELIKFSFNFENTERLKSSNPLIANPVCNFF